MPETQPELVILVHGTFAASDSDYGGGWWQAGGRFGTKLNERLQGKARCADIGEVFHWSGKNLESERRAASQKLADRFLELEAKGHPYHVIAHSHGGNVVLAAIAECRRPLKFLRSWTTVGSPFFRYRVIPFHTLSWIAMIVVGSPFLCLAVLILHYTLYIFNIAYEPTIYLDAGITGAFCVIMLFSIAAKSGLEFVTGLDELWRGSFQRKWKYPWLSIWTQQDEAVSGLSSMSRSHFRLPRVEIASRETTSLLMHSVQRRIRILPGIIRPTTRAVAIFLAGFSWIASCLIYPFWNWFVVPRGDKFVNSSLRQKAFGDDTFGMTIQSVKPSPFDFSVEIPEVPEPVSHALVQSADERTRESNLLSESRSVLIQCALGQVSTGQMRDLLGQKLNGRELVHTSYFDNDDVIEILAHHIEASMGVPHLRESASNREWLYKFYSATQQTFVQKGS